MEMVILALVLATQVAQAATGSLVGCISDPTTQRLPRSTVVATGGGVQRTVVADSMGCYEMRDLPPASYRVTARLQGFDSVTRDRVVLEPANVTRVDFALRISPICECIRVLPPRTVAEAWERADAVLHVRISEPGAGSPIQGTYRHTATVLNGLKYPAGEPGAATIAVHESQRNGATGPYDVGQELVIFPRWSPKEHAFLGLGLDCCDNAGTVFVVQNGRIERAPSDFPRYEGMRIEVFLEELRALGRAGKKSPLH